MHQRGSLLQIAQDQGGVVLRHQALEAGYSASRIARCVTSGEWERVTRGGYRLLKPADRFDLVRAAIAVLPNAVVSHHSAAAVHRLQRVSREWQSVSVPSKTTHAFPGVVVHRYDDLDSGQVVSLRGLPVTSISRTIVDLARVLSRPHLAAVVDDAVADSRVTIDELDRDLAMVARKGKPGVVAMRSVVDERAARWPTGTILERRGTQLLVDAGIVGFLQEYPIPWSVERRFDLAFPSERVAIEWDSRRWHMQIDAMRLDRERDRSAVQHGWRVLRFTWQDVHDAPIAVVDTVRSVLAT